MKKLFVRITSIIALLLLSLSLSGCWLFIPDAFVPEYPDSTAVSKEVIIEKNETGRTLMSRIDAVAKVERSVVAINMEYRSVTNSTGTVWGSGVIIDNANNDDNVFYIITCHHVIESKGNITVYVPDLNSRNHGDKDYDSKFKFTGKIDSDSRTGEVTLIGGDKLADIAVLKLDITGSGVSKSQITCAVLPPETYSIKRGEDVFAIGNPGGSLPMTVSAGIVSYLDRWVGINSVGYMTIIQIDVQINHGNSGGGLFNLYGELVGITNAGRENLDGINYAVPYKYAYSNGGFLDIITQLIGTYQNFEGKNFGYISGSWEMGITLGIAYDSASGEYYQTNTVSSVVKNSNSYNVLQEGDVIKKVSSYSLNYSKTINTGSDLSDALCVLRTYLRLGDSFKITFYRNGGETERQINLTRQMIFCDTGYNIPIQE